jgi:tetratricopeptide (TPR) repeat protein
MSLLFAGTALAATVAVLDFDAYGTDFGAAGVATEGVRDAFLEDGRLDPVGASDIAEGASAGNETSLTSARERLAAGRKALDRGDVDGALPLLAESVQLHAEAHSDIGRRAEMADAQAALGAALVKAGRRAEADAAFREASVLFPGYATARAANLPAEAKAALTAADAAAAAAGRRWRSERTLQDLRDRLGADWVVAGYLEADGRVVARIYGAPGMAGQAEASLASMPPASIDEGYGALAGALARAASEGGAVAATGGEEPPDEEEAEALADDEADEAAEAARPGTATRPGKKPAADKPLEIRQGRRATGGGEERYDPSRAGPWWPWAVAGAAVAGGAVVVVAVMAQPDPEVVHEPDSWSVTVKTE